MEIVEVSVKFAFLVGDELAFIRVWCTRLYAPRVFFSRRSLFRDNYFSQSIIFRIGLLFFDVTDFIGSPIVLRDPRGRDRRRFVVV